MATLGQRVGAWAMRSWPEWFQRDPELKRVVELSGGSDSTAGQSVSPNTAMNYSAVWSAVSIISQSIGSLPCCVYKATDTGREKLTKSPLFWLLHEEPNPAMTPFQFFETALHHVLISGNFYAEIKRNNAGGVAQLWPADPYSITPELVGGTLVYRDSATSQTVSAKDMVHVPGLGWDGIRGYSVIMKARQSIGLGIAAEKFGGAFWGNGAWPGIALEHPKTLTQPAQDRLVGNIERRHQGADKAWRAFVAEEGMQVKTLSIPNDDAQFLETRQFQIEEIARWFNVPLTKLKSKAGERPGGNIEAQNIEFVVDCLRPWLVRIEQELNRKLVPMRERPDTYCEFNVGALLRGDAKSRADTYKVYLDMGVISADWIAATENLPAPTDRESPLPTKVENVGQLIRAGFEPEESLKIVGLPPIKHTGQTPVTVKDDSKPKQAFGQPVPGDEPEEPEEEPEEEKSERARRSALRTLIVDGMDRLIRIQVNEARRGAKWSEFREKHRPRLLELFEPAMRLASPLKPESIERAASLADQYLDRHADDLRGAKDVAALTVRWEREVPAEVADLILGGR